MDDFLGLKLYVKEKLQKSKVTISCQGKRNDNCKTSSTILFINKKPLQSISKVIDNSNISDCCLSRDGLYLNNTVISFLNVNILTNKIEACIVELCKNLEIDIICIDQSKLHCPLLNSAFKIHGYNIHLLEELEITRVGVKLSMFRMICL